MLQARESAKTLAYHGSDNIPMPPPGVPGVGFASIPGRGLHLFLQQRYVVEAQCFARGTAR